MKKPWGQKGVIMKKMTSCVQGATLVLVVLGWIAVPFFTEHLRKKSEIGMWQYTAMSDAHRNLLTALHEIEQYLNELISKYNCEAIDVFSKMSDEELNKANRLMRQINTELAMMYMIMPDNKYKVIRDTIDPEHKKTLREQRQSLLAAMRKSQFPDTKFNKLENIRFFYAFKRPDKEVKTQQ